MKIVYISERCPSESPQNCGIWLWFADCIGTLWIRRDHLMHTATIRFAEIYDFTFTVEVYERTDGRYTGRWICKECGVEGWLETNYLELQICTHDLHTHADCHECRLIR